MRRHRGYGRRGTISRLSRATSKLADFVISILLHTLIDLNLAASCAGRGSPSARGVVYLEHLECGH